MRYKRILLKADFEPVEEGGFTYAPHYFPLVLRMGIHLRRRLRILRMSWGFILKQTIKMLIGLTERY